MTHVAPVSDGTEPVSRGGAAGWARRIGALRRLFAQFVPLPVFTKEMRSRFRGRRTPVLLFTVTTLICALVIGILCFNWPGTLAPTEMNVTLARLGQLLLALMLGAQILAAVLLVPAFTGSAFAGERQAQSLDLLLLTPLSNANLAAGKLLSAVGFLLFVQLCALPLAGIAFLLGGVSPGQLITGECIVLGTIFSLGAAGVYSSLLFRQSVASLVMAYVIGVAVVAFIPGLMLVGGEIGYEGTQVYLSAIPIVIPLGLLLGNLIAQTKPERFGIPIWRQTLYWAIPYIVAVFLLQFYAHDERDMLSNSCTFGITVLLLLPLLLWLSRGLGKRSARKGKPIPLLAQGVLLLVLYGIVFFFGSMMFSGYVSLDLFSFDSGRSGFIWLLGNPFVSLIHIERHIRSSASDWFQQAYPVISVYTQFAIGGIFFYYACKRLAHLRAGGAG